MARALIVNITSFSNDLITTLQGKSELVYQKYSQVTSFIFFLLFHFLLSKGLFLFKIIFIITLKTHL